MSNQSTDRLSADLTQYKGRLVGRYPKTKGWISSPVAGDGARLDAAADSILKAIKAGSVSFEMAELSFKALKICGDQLLDNEKDMAMDFATKEQEREQLFAILTHIQNVNRKHPDNAKALKEEIRGTDIADIWSDVDGIRAESQSKNWARLKIALFALMCAIAIAIVVTAMLTPVGWAGVGAFFIGMAANFFMPYLSQLIGSLVISAVTLGFMKTMRPLDTLAFERQLSTRTEKRIDTQKRESTDALLKFDNEHAAESKDTNVDDDLDAPRNQALPPARHPSWQHSTPTRTATQSNGGAGSREKLTWEALDTDSNGYDSEGDFFQQTAPNTYPVNMGTSSQKTHLHRSNMPHSSAGRPGLKQTTATHTQPNISRNSFHSNGSKNNGQSQQQQRFPASSQTQSGSSNTKDVSSQKNKANFTNLRNQNRTRDFDQNQNRDESFSNRGMKNN